MGVTAAVHPTDQMLHAYGMGKLDDNSSKSVHKHLESCAECQRRVAEMSSDSFLGRLRDAQSQPKSSRPVMSSLTGISMIENGSSSKAPPPTGSLPPGLANHPDYQVIRELGQGGMGTVYLAENRLMGRYEVLKVVSSHLIGRAGVLDRFLAEIRNAARLHHTNVVTAYSASRLGESIVFAMEYVDGLDLAKLVRTKGPLPVANACSYVHQAALGLQHAAEHGLVHRDIKPSNLMLARQGKRAVIKVLDFGLAKIQSERAVDGGLTHEGQMLGTPDYIAPEQIRDARGSDIRADIYSLACTLYYLLTGGPPFKATSLYDLLQAHHSMYATPLNLVRPDVPIELAALVAKMMAKEPERRFQMPSDVAQALTPFFKKGAAAASVSSADNSQLGQPNAKRGFAGARSRLTPPENPVARANVTGDAGPTWESLIDLNESEQSVAPIQQRSAKWKAVVAADSSRRPFWVLPMMAVGGLFVGIVASWAAGAFGPTAPNQVVEREKPRENAQGDVRKAAEPVAADALADGVTTNPAGKPKREPASVDRDKSVDARRRISAPVSNDDGFRPLLDDADLAGWYGLPGIWRMKDGTLTGNTFPDGVPYNTCLCSDREYADFELAFQAQITAGWPEDSGVQIRSRVLDPRKYIVAGPQCDLGTQGNKIYWGNLWGEKFGGETRPHFTAGSGLLLQTSPNLQSKVVRPAGYFNDVEVRCVGKRVTIKVNGETTVDDEVSDLPPRGIIGWQVHSGKPMEVKFRRMRIREL
jgi:serine/threonine protein kinase